LQATGWLKKEATKKSKTVSLVKPVQSTFQKLTTNYCYKEGDFGATYELCAYNLGDK
jgi:hypothetical protein